MRKVEDVRKLSAALVAFCMTNGRHHSEKSPIEQQCDDLAAILNMKLEMLESHLSDQTPESAGIQNKLASTLADLALMASAGTLQELLGDEAANLEATMNTVKNAGDAQLAAGLESIDKGNYMRNRGETSARLALMTEKQNLINKKLGE